MMKQKREFRSDKYQWIILEVPIDMASISETVDLDNQLHSVKYSTRFSELNDQAFARILEIAEKVLTPRQHTVMTMYLEGMTQTEIANKLGCNQSSITKTLNGNCDYKNANGTKTYGGSKKKLKKYVLQDNIMKQIMAEMRVCDDLLWKMRNPNPDTVYCQPVRHVNSNIYYLISSLFHNDDEYLAWITSGSPSNT